MLIFPAIDLFEGKAVRLLRGDYSQMTVYSEKPAEVAKSFEKQGATHLHLVDLEGARSGGTPNLETVGRIVSETSLFTEVGGGIRSMETIEKYIEIGVDRVILGTAAVCDEELLRSAVLRFGGKIAVGVDVRDGYAAIKGWTELSEYTCLDFCKKMRGLGIETLICTDISKDGAMRGTNLGMYRELSQSLDLQIVASGGVSSIDDVKELAEMRLYGAIIGKAYYTGAVSLSEAIEVAK